MRPVSSGSRSASSAARGNSGSSSRNSTPWCASEISPGRGGEPPPTSATALAVWCGARNGRCRPARRRRSAPARLSDRPRWPALRRRHRRQQAGKPLRQHRLAGARRADHQQAVAAGGGDLERALGGGLALARRAGRAAPAPATRRARHAPRAAAARPHRRAAELRTTSSRWRAPYTVTAVDQRRLARAGLRAAPACATPPPWRAAPAPGPARRAPAAARRPATTRRRIRRPPARAASICPPAARMPSAIGRSKRPDSLGRSAGARLTVMRLLCGKLQAAVLQRRAHALARFLDFGVGQADQREAGQAVGQMHLDRAPRARPGRRARGCAPRPSVMCWSPRPAGLRVRGDSGQRRQRAVVPSKAGTAMVRARRRFTALVRAVAATLGSALRPGLGRAASHGCWHGSCKKHAILSPSTSLESTHHGKKALARLTAALATAALLPAVSLAPHAGLQRRR